MGVTPSLVPDAAANSIARRLQIIRECEAYVRCVSARYANSERAAEFNILLREHGLTAAVAAIVEKGE